MPGSYVEYLPYCGSHKYVNWDKSHSQCDIVKMDIEAGLLHYCKFIGTYWIVNIGRDDRAIGSSPGEGLSTW